MIVVHFPEAGFRLMFPRRCSLSMKRYEVKSAIGVDEM